MEPEENEHGDGEGNQNTVFVDTSLDTHLATIVSDSDTVTDLKRKIMLEHLQCFPAHGDIRIHCLKVKRRGNYYHLADSMLVKSAFGAGQKNWFLSVDASSHVEQCEGIQHKAGDQHQLALPWVKDSLSIDRHDALADRPSKLSLIHGSPSKHHKIVPFVNQKVPSVDQFTSDDSCKKVSKNVEEDRSSNLEPAIEQQLDSKAEEKLQSVNKEINLKKRVRDVHNEDTSVKRRRRTRRKEGDLKALEEDKVLTNDADKAKDMGTSINDENSIEDKLKSKESALDGVVTKAMNDEHNTRTISVSQKKTRRTKKSRIPADDQVSTVVPLSLENAGEEICPLKNSEASEVMPDAAMVVEKNIQQETPIQLSQKEKGNELVHEADIGNEMPSSSMKGVTAEDELQVSQTDNLVVDNSSTVPTPVFDEQNNDKTNIISDEKNEVLEKTQIDDSVVYNDKAGDLIMKEVKIAEPTESHRSRVHKEKPKKEIKETAGNRIKKKDVGKSLKKDEILKHTNDAAIGKNEDNLLLSELKESLEITTSKDALNVDNDAEMSKTSQQNAEISEKQNETNMDDDDDTKKNKKKRKAKKSDARNEKVDLHEKIADGDKVNKSKDAAQVPDEEGLVKKPKRNNKSSARAHSGMPSKLDLETEKSKIPEEPSKNATESPQVPKGNDVISDVDVPKEGSREIDFMEYFSPTQQKSPALDNLENGKDTKLPAREKKPKKKSKEQTDSAIQSLSRNENSNNKELSVSKKVPEASTVKDPNKTKTQTLKTTTKIDAAKPQLGSSSESFGRSFKITKQQASKGQNQVKNLKKSAPVAAIKSLLNTPGTIFGDDSEDSSANDNATVNSNSNSNSSTRTPSRKSSSSSSGESDSSIDSRRYAAKRKEGAGKNNLNSQSKSKNMSMADLLRSSSRFKKARVTASKQVNDTESQPVDFVPESQPLPQR